MCYARREYAVQRAFFRLRYAGGNFHLCERRLRATRSEDGSSLLELALVLPFLLLLLLGVVDFSRGYYLGLEVSAAAHAAALYGSQHDTDITGMQNAALADASDVPNFTSSSVTASYGCECSDGSSASASCSVVPTCATNVVDYVQVATSATYNVLFPWPGVPASLTLSGNARMRAAK